MLKQLAAAPQQSLVKKTEVVLLREVITSLQDSCQGAVMQEFLQMCTSGGTFFFFPHIFIILSIQLKLNPHNPSFLMPRPECAVSSALSGEGSS